MRSGCPPSHGPTCARRSTVRRARPRSASSARGRSWRRSTCTTATRPTRRNGSRARAPSREPATETAVQARGARPGDRPTGTAPGSRLRAHTGRTRSPGRARRGCPRPGSGPPTWTRRRPRPPARRCAGAASPDYRAAVTRTAVFGAGAMGTAVAMHAVRRGHDVTLWGSAHDERPPEGLRAEGKRPSPREHLPAEIRVFGPGEIADASAGAEIAILGANSHGARSLARELAAHLDGVDVAVSVAKGLEPGSGLRMSQVYAEELTETPIVSVGGPCL